MLDDRNAVDLLAEPPAARFLSFADPRGAVEATRHEYRLRLTRGDARIALVCNGFPGALRFLSMLEEVLAGLEPAWTFVHYQKPVVSGAAPDGLLDRIIDQCDAAIGAYGHCGSCTAGTVRDSVNLAERALPSVALVTEHFEDCGKLVADGLGHSGLPQIILPYPLALRSDREIREIVRAAAPKIVAALRTGA
jgi:hypothetical protein